MSSGWRALPAALLPWPNFRHAVYAPDEFFYGDLYASRPTGCTSETWGGPAPVTSTRPASARSWCGSRPTTPPALRPADNDFHSPPPAPEAQTESIAKADLNFARLVEAAGEVGSPFPCATMR